MHYATTQHAKALLASVKFTCGFYVAGATTTADLIRRQARVSRISRMGNFRKFLAK